MGAKYNFHKDFKLFAKFTMGKLSPGSINMSNAMAKLLCGLIKLPSGITVRRYSVTSYDGANIRITVYEPKHIKDAAAPCLVYFHGGAFVLQEMPLNVHLACEYALSVPCKVVFVHYRLALKHPFPKGLEDCYSSLVWVSKNAEKLGIDPARIAVGGESAGGTLAAAVALMARDRKGPELCLQMLVYPALDLDQKTESVKQFVDTPICNSRIIAQAWEIYLANGYFGMISYASPAKAESLCNLPSAYIETAEFDCLRDEGRDYAVKLRKCGVEVQLEETKGTIHGYDGVRNSKLTRTNVKKRIELLRRAFTVNDN